MPVLVDSTLVYAMCRNFEAAVTQTRISKPKLMALDIFFKSHIQDSLLLNCWGLLCNSLEVFEHKWHYRYEGATVRYIVTPKQVSCMNIMEPLNTSATSERVDYQVHFGQEENWRWKIRTRVIFLHWLGLRPIILDADISCFFDKPRIIQGFDVNVGRDLRPCEDVGHAGWSGSFR